MILDEEDGIKIISRESNPSHSRAFIITECQEPINEFDYTSLHDAVHNLLYHGCDVIPLYVNNVPHYVQTKPNFQLHVL